MRNRPDFHWFLPIEITFVEHLAQEDSSRVLDCWNKAICVYLFAQHTASHEPRFDRVNERTKQVGSSAEQVDLRVARNDHPQPEQKRLPDGQWQVTPGSTKSLPNEIPAPANRSLANGLRSSRLGGNEKSETRSQCLGPVIWRSHFHRSTQPNRSRSRQQLLVFFSSRQVYQLEVRRGCFVRLDPEPNGRAHHGLRTPLQK